MTRYWVNFTLLNALVFWNCAPYKQLTPEPPISSAEKGAQPIKKGNSEFEIKPKQQYFISFPAPPADHFYLVLDISNKQNLKSFFTNTLLKKKTVGQKIKDETLKPDQFQVFPFDQSHPEFFWIIDSVQNKDTLQIKYRYTPQWRFKWENHRAAFGEILKGNTVNQRRYKGLGISFKFKDFDFVAEEKQVSGHLTALKKVMEALLAIESIFPKNILNSQDTAYLNYHKLRKQFDGEIQFQGRYLTVLDFFKKEHLTRDNPVGFLQNLPTFHAFFSEKTNHPINVIKESQTVMRTDLEALIPFFDTRLVGKTDYTPFDQSLYFTDSIPSLKKLYERAAIPIPEPFKLLDHFINDFYEKISSLSSAQDSLAQLKNQVEEKAPFPEKGFFGNLSETAATLMKNFPSPMTTGYGKYQSYQSTQALNKALRLSKKSLGTAFREYGQAEKIVGSLNALKALEHYTDMLAELNNNENLAFLLDLYMDLDKMSIEKQAQEIQGSLDRFLWAEAETRLSRLHRDKEFLNPDGVKDLKIEKTKEGENALYTKIDQVSRGRVNDFVTAHFNTLQNVDSLYEDSVFLPAYTVTFSSGSQLELLQRQEALVAHLAELKENEFPAKAITLLYDEFVKNPKDSGVYKARAVVTHGKHYQMEDKKIKRRIRECNPYSAKWIVKPKQYRRVFAMPVTNNEKGKNLYFIRLNIRIPTEAKFPVYDVNIKLPRAIGKGASKTKWYEKIKLNKKQLKNEGRFSIGAPTEENNFECQITPVRMLKGKSNILDITFKHRSFKVHSVSVMVQKPIIKKN